MNKFEEKISKVIDYRKINIPIVWVPSKKEAANTTQADYGSVWTSCPEGRLTTKITDMIDSAQETIIVCSFLLADKAIENALYNAARCGVRVYLMLACETRLDNDNPDDEFEKKCLEQHIGMLEMLAGRTMIRSASHYHAKAVLIDAIGSDTSMSKGILLTANLTTEALERNEELAVDISNSEIEELASIFKWAFFEYAEHQMLDNTNFESVKPLNKVVYPSDLSQILSTNSNESSIQAHALELINNAEKELIISSFGWQEDHAIVEAICNKAQQGVEVTILARIRPSVMPALLKLKKSGANVFGFKWLHAKVICSDSTRAIIMSANLQKHGLDEGFEIGARLTDKKANNLKSALLGFLNNKHSSLELDVALGDLQGPIKLWCEASNEFLDRDIVQSKEMQLDSVEAECASDLHVEVTIPKNNDPESHEVVYKWSVKPRHLPEQATEIFREEEKIFEKKDNKGKPIKEKKIIKYPYSPKVYKLKNQLFIAISELHDLPNAVKLKESEFTSSNIVLTR